MKSSDHRPDWQLLRGMTDEEAEARAARDPDAPPTDADFWRNARVMLPPGKTKISLYLDNDVLAWFRGQGRGYQTRINAVLRSFMDAQRPERADEVAEPQARYDCDA